MNGAFSDSYKNCAENHGKLREGRSVTIPAIFASVLASPLTQKLLYLIGRSLHEGKLFLENAELSKSRMGLTQRTGHDRR